MRLQVFAYVHSLDKILFKYLFSYRNSFHHMPTENKSWRVPTQTKKIQIIIKYVFHYVLGLPELVFHFTI